VRYETVEQCRELETVVIACRGSLLKLSEDNSTTGAEEMLTYCRDTLELVRGDLLELAARGVQEGRKLAALKSSERYLVRVRDVLREILFLQGTSYEPVDITDTLSDITYEDQLLELKQ